MIKVIHKQIGEVPFLFFCLLIWVLLFSLVLLLSGNAAYLSGFLLGAAGSALYAYLLYRRVPVLLTRPFTLKAASPQPGRRGRSQPAGLQYLWSGWVKIIQPIAAIALIILMVSRFFQQVSFLAALFGFFSFQISLFLYAILISVYPFFGENDRG